MNHRLSRKFRLLLIAAACTVVLAGVKFALHSLQLEGITLGSLHASVATGTFFVIGFLLSATIADYKESEKIPAEFAATIENMHEDARAIHHTYSAFDIDSFRLKLRQIIIAFEADVRNSTVEAHRHIHELHDFFTAMETAKVPPNFIVKFKQEQAQLVKSLFRVSYIQRITFIPSASILAQSIVALNVLLLLFTEVEPFYGGMALVAIISFIFIYILLLLKVISTPFHREGKTRDDVSLFLLSQTATRLDAKIASRKAKAAIAK